MNLVLVAAMALAAAPADTGDRAVIQRLKKVATVSVRFGVGPTATHVMGIELRINGEPDAKDVAAAVKDLAGLPHLDTIVLFGPAFTDDAVQQLAEAKSLRDVQFHRTRVSDAGIKVLASLPKLRKLVFWGSGLTDKGLKEVARMKTLQYLEITDAPITDEGLKELAALKELKRLQITNSQATPAALRLLRLSLPLLESQPLRMK